MKFSSTDDGRISYQPVSDFYSRDRENESQQNCQQPKKLVPVEVPVIPRETVIILAEFPKKPKTCSRWLRTPPHREMRPKNDQKSASESASERVINEYLVSSSWFFSALCR